MKEKLLEEIVSDLRLIWDTPERVVKRVTKKAIEKYYRSRKRP